ncbi:MAG: 50S ribosomal protein L4, partial [Patescibacteria group bacterium]
MSTVKVYNLDGAETGVMELDSKVFSETGSSELFYQVVRVLQANSRTVLAHTKDRSQVRGGGKKPWAQKGTGRARHGSIRSPIWVGGGVTFGPTAERNFSLGINRKMVKKAIRAAVSSRVSEEAFYVLDDAALAEPATKKFVSFLKKLKLSDKKVLCLTE